ncbi:MAG: ABC transporter permease [Deltaproteobacteria bacterium]|nr:ABC transporter permease [Deltaproteobacteria bacterium]
MSFEPFIAKRFLLKGTASGAFSSLTLLSWLAIGVGVAAMSCLLSVMYGFETALKDRVLKAYPHVILKPRTGDVAITDFDSWTARLAGIPEVRRVLPYVESEMIVESQTRTLGAVLRGLPQEELTKLRTDIVEGTLPDPSKEAAVLLGSELAGRLAVGVGDSIQVISPTEGTGMLGLVPKSQSYRVSGLYSSGHYDFDQQFLFTDIEEAQNLLKLEGRISGWQLWASDLERADQVAKAVSQMVPAQWQAQSWTQFNQALFHSLKLEQYAMFSILSLAIVIAVMNIIITLMMHVTHKRKNIGILRALGASRPQIRNIFIWEGAWLGASGLALGAVCTSAFIVYVRYFSSYQLPEIYYDRTIPIELRPLSVLAIYLVAIALIFLGTLYPAAKASNLDPVEAIREAHG